MHAEAPSPVLYSFGQMLDLYGGGTFQICNGAGQAQDPVVGPGRQIQPERGLFEKRQAARCQFTIPVQLLYFHVGIAVNSAGITEPFPLDFPGLLYPGRITADDSAEAPDNPATADDRIDLPDYRPETEDPAAGKAPAEAQATADAPVCSGIRSSISTGLTFS